MAEEDLGKKLDRIAAILLLAHKDAIDAARRKVLADPVSEALLDESAEEWISAGELTSRVSTRTKQSKRTVSRRVGELLELGFLEKAGATANLKYRSTGLA